MSRYFRFPFAEDGEKVAIADDLQSSGIVSYQQGWTYDYQRKLGTDPLAKPVPRQQTNQLNYDITSAIKQYQEHGFYDFITAAMNAGNAFSYSMGACVRYDMSDAQDGSDVRNFSSKINNNTSNPKSNPNNWQEIGKAVSAYQFTTINTSTMLTEDQAGIILIDASAGNITLTLPSTDSVINYILRRIDNTINIVRVQTTNIDRIRFNQKINANGYSFFYLFGAGDYWNIVSDGQGSWFDIDRDDKTKIGNTNFITSTITPSSGYLVANGSELNRSDYPFLWDFAQQSGMLVIEADRAGNEGAFTSGNGTSTFRIPDLRGEFLRALDNGRGVDLDRVAGSWQKDEFKSHTHNITPMSPENAVTNLGIVAWSSRREVVKTTEATGGDETRPRNIAYPIYIKII